MADTKRLGRFERELVQVQVLSSVPFDAWVLELAYKSDLKSDAR